MFSKKHQLLQKTGPDGIGRYDYLRLLKKEFLETKSEETKHQVLANLANFAYDPINYDYIRSLQLIDVFLEHLYAEDKTLIGYSIAALCNLSSDPANKEIIIRKNGVTLISEILQRQDEDIVLNGLATLIFLRKEQQNERNEFTSPVLTNKINELKSHKNKRIVNLATIFLQSNNV